MTELPAIAVIADAHLHDIHSDYDRHGATINGEHVNLRSWQDTRRSSRVFNESGDALRTALTDIHQRGVRHVVLLGDYTDDGQIESTKRLAKLLHHYRREYDMAFYAIPGNHDVYGPAGKHQSTRFISTADTTVLVTSDPELAATESDTSVLTQSMYCEGSPAGLFPMADFGLFKQAGYKHWETPFGASDTPASRTYEAHSADGSAVHSLMDASYLVEPCEGIWLLMIDANVFEPRNGQGDPSRKSTFLNSSDAGWNAVLRVKPFLIDWINDVATRAELLEKRLLAFSHYPTIDPIDHDTMSEAQLFGHNEVVRRTPDSAVAECLLAAGVDLHFSGHMHVNNTTQLKTAERTFTDIAVPSLVSFPAAYKIIHSTTQSCQIETLPIGAMLVDPTLIKQYHAHNNHLDELDKSALSATTYGEFLYRKMHTRVVHHYLKKDWPADISSEIGNTTAVDLAYLFMVQKNSPQTFTFGAMQNIVTPNVIADLNKAVARYELTLDDLTNCSMVNLIADWYCLRQAGSLARPYITDTNLKLYAYLAESVNEAKSPTGDTHAAYLSLFIEGFQHSLNRVDQNNSMGKTNLMTLITQKPRH